MEKNFETVDLSKSSSGLTGLGFICIICGNLQETNYNHPTIHNLCDHCINDLYEIIIEHRKSNKNWQIPVSLVKTPIRKWIKDKESQGNHISVRLHNVLARYFEYIEDVTTEKLAKCRNTGEKTIREFEALKNGN